jgi:outer membrane protein
LYFPLPQLKSCLVIFSLAFITAFSLPVFAVQDSVLAEANTLILKRDFSAAYQLLEPLESERAGDVDYDYLFGVAGVESGNVSRGAFALERVLALDPNHQDARAEMAKAHFILGEIEASKAEFNNVLKQSPNAATKKTIDKLLNAIDKLEGTTTTFGAYLEGGLGYDSNVSSAPGLTAISVPVFGGALLDLGSGGKKESDTFNQLAAGVSVRHPISSQLSAFGLASVNNKNNLSEKFDTRTYDVNAGFQYTQAQNSYTIAFQNNHFYLDGDAFRRAYGATVQWLHNIDDKSQAGLFMQYSRLNFIGSSFRNADRTIFGLNVGHIFQAKFAPVLFASLYGGKEEARNNDFEFLDQDITGLRLGGQLSFSSQWQMFSSLSAEYRHNDADDPAFLEKRKDRQYDVTLGLNFIPAPSWLIKSQFSYSKNESNVDLNGFERSILSISARKNFNW